MKKHGIEFEGDGSTGTLVSADGERTIVQKNNNGNAVFLGYMPVTVRHAIAEEFDRDLGPRDDKEIYVVVLADDLSPQFIFDYIGAGLKCDRHLQRYFCVKPGFEEQVSRLGSASSQFAVSATEFLRRAHKRDRVFSLHVQQQWSESFAVMVGLGFFVRVGDYYRMVIPHDPSIETIVEELIRLAETEDQEYLLHPERHLATLTRFSAKDLRKSLRKRLREKWSRASAFSVENGATDELG